MEKSIEYNFFKFFLQILIVGALLVTSSDLFAGASYIVDVGVTATLILSYILLRFQSLKVSVLFFTSFIFAIMLYRSFALNGFYAGNRIIMFLTLGFIYSLLLKAPWRWIMHAVTLFGLLSLFTMQFMHPENFQGKGADVISEGLPYFVIYVSISLSTMILKDKYDAQKEELIKRQNELNAINDNLEELVRERSDKIIEKNKQLAKYAFTNAHRVRGPLARILGLIYVSSLETETDYPFLFEKVKIEAEEIDKILKEINEDLHQQID